MSFEKIDRIILWYKTLAVVSTFRHVGHVAFLDKECVELGSPSGLTAPKMLFVTLNPIFLNLCIHVALFVTKSTSDSKIFIRGSPCEACCDCKSPSTPNF